jgi:ABC-type branched-subunit amino acid transport system substrate-binding protein
VFGWGVSTGFCNNPYAFAITGCIVAPGRLSTFPSTWGRLLDQLLRDRGVGGARGKTAAIVAQHDAGGRQALTAVGAAARAGGFRVVYAQPVVPPPPALPLDYSPYAQAVLTANAGAPADVVFLVVDVTSTVELGRQLRAAGYRGVVTNATTYDPRLVAATAGQTVLTQVAVPEAAPTDPTLAGIVATIRRSAGPVPITQPMLAGYLAADFFVQALRRAGRHVTAASLAATAARLTYTIRGVVGPTRYPAAQRLATPCGALLESTGAAYRLARPYACFQNVDVHTLQPVRG